MTLNKSTAANQNTDQAAVDGCHDVVAFAHPDPVGALMNPDFIEFLVLSPGEEHRSNPEQQPSFATSPLTKGLTQSTWQATSRRVVHRFLERTDRMGKRKPPGQISANHIIDFPNIGLPRH